MGQVQIEIHLLWRASKRMKRSVMPSGLNSHTYQKKFQFQVSPLRPVTKLNQQCQQQIPSIFNATRFQHNKKWIAFSLWWTFQPCGRGKLSSRSNSRNSIENRKFKVFCFVSAVSAKPKKKLDKIFMMQWVSSICCCFREARIGLKKIMMNVPGEYSRLMSLKRKKKVEKAVETRAKWII